MFDVTTIIMNGGKLALAVYISTVVGLTLLMVGGEYHQECLSEDKKEEEKNGSSDKNL